MASETISNALRRVRTLFERRPQVAQHTDTAAVARWQGDMRVISTYENRTTVVTDMPAELGGTGDQVTPGWLLRAGLAACLATRIAMEAAERGVQLRKLEVRADSQSDARGLLGMSDERGERISAAPRQVNVTVSISAAGIDAEELRTMIVECQRASPVTAALQASLTVDLHFDVQ
jgi:uncharacterized OsmC-like protein